MHSPPVKADTNPKYTKTVLTLINMLSLLPGSFLEIVFESHSCQAQLQHQLQLTSKQIITQLLTKTKLGTTSVSACPIPCVIGCYKMKKC